MSPKKKKRSYLSILSGGIKKLWRQHKSPTPIKALHTEITIEPQPFINGTLNPQIAEFLIGVYLQKIKVDPLFNGEIEIKDGYLRIKDKDGKVIASTSSPRVINEYLN